MQIKYFSWVKDQIGIESENITITEKIDSVIRAKTGLDDVLELAYTTAEHHPYWAILYNCAEISKSLLEKWHDDISKDDLDEIKWHLKETENSCKNLENN